MDAAAPLPADDAEALLRIIDERLAALTAEAIELRTVRNRLLARIGSEGETNARAA